MTAMTSRNTVRESRGDEFSTRAPISVVGVGLDSDTGDWVRRYIDSMPMVRLRSLLPVYQDKNHDSVADWIGMPAPDVCLIDFDKDRRNAAAAAERIHGSSPETAIFAVSSASQPELIIDAMRSGCSEYLVKPLDRDELLTALARVGGRKKEQKREEHNAQVITFVGAKGGCGVTTLATQLGALLAKMYGKKTLLIDLHPDFGDAALYLGLTKHRYNSFELIENNERLDSEFLQSFLVRHSSGMDLIPAPDGAEPARLALPGTLAKTLDFLRMPYEFILIDSPPGLTEQNLDLIRYSDQVYLVTVAEVSALRNVVRHVDYFAHKQVSDEKMKVVLNRYQKRGLISDSEIEKVIRKRIFWKVPNQYSHVLKTINGGDPISQLSSSDVMRNLNEWAAGLGSTGGSDEKKKDTSGLFKFLNR